MSEPTRRPPSPSKATEAAFIDAAEKEFPAGADVILLQGYLRKTTAEGRWRLYASPTFNDYAEFDRKDVVHTEPVPVTATDPLGGTFVWLKSSALLQVASSRVAEARAAYQAVLLSGDITQKYLASSLDDVWSRLCRSRSARSCKGINCCPDS